MKRRHFQKSQHLTIYVSYRPKRSFGQGNVFTPVCHSVNRGGVPDQAPPKDQAGTPPWDQAGTPPGPGRYPPGTRQVHPLGPGRYTPQTRNTPLGPGRYTLPGPGRYTPRDQAGTPPRIRQLPCPQDQTDIPPGPGRYTPPEAADPGIRSTIGRMHSCLIVLF